MVSPFLIITRVSGQIKANEIISTRNWQTLYSSSDMKKWQYKCSIVMVINNTHIRSKLMNTPPWLDLWPRCYSANFQPGASLTTLVIVRWSLGASIIVQLIRLLRIFYYVAFSLALHMDWNTYIQVYKKKLLSYGAFKTDTSTKISTWIVSRKVLSISVLYRVFGERPWSSIILD